MATYDLLNSLEQHRDDNSDWEWDDIIDYPVSVGVDIGTSIVNSMSWLTDYKVETSSALAALNTDMADFYENHRDAVELGSFIGGIFVPMGAGKLLSSAMKFAGSGKVTALNQPFKSWDNKILGFQNKAAELLVKEGHANSAAKAAKRTFQVEAFKKGAAEAMAYETGFAALYNGHAYLDGNYDVWDYALGVGLGLGLGSVGTLIKSTQFKKTYQAAQVADIGQLGDNFTPAMKVAGVADGIGAAQGIYTIKAQEAVLLNQVNSLGADTIALATQTLDRTRVATGKHIYSMLDGELQGLTTTKAKGARPASIYESYDALGQWNATPFELVSKVVYDNPEALVGVSKPIKHYTNVTNPFSMPLPEDIMRMGKGRQDIYVPDPRMWLTQTKPQTGKVLKSSQHRLFGDMIPGLTTKLDNATDTYIINVDRATDLKKPEIRKFVHNAMELNVGRKVSIRTAKGKFDNEYLKSLQPTKDLPFDVSLKLDNSLVGMDDLDTLATKYQYRTTKVVIDPWGGRPVMINALEASVSKGVASNPKWRANRTYDILNGKKTYKPLESSTYHADEEFMNATFAYELAGKSGFINNQIIQAGDTPRIQAALIYASKKLNADPKLTLNLKVGDEVITDLEDLAHLLFRTKVSDAIELIKDTRGLTYGQIAKQTNASIEFIEHVVQNRQLLAKGLHEQPRKLFFLENISESSHIMYNELNHTKFLNAKPLLLEGDGMVGARATEIQTAANLDKDTTKELFRGAINDVMTTSSPDVQGFHELVSGTEPMRILLDNISALATRGTMGKYNFTSREMAQRVLGANSEYISASAKAFNSSVIRFLDEVTTSVQPTFAAVNKNEVARTLFYQFRQTLDAMPSTQLENLMYDATTGKIITKLNAEGEPIAYLKFLSDDTKEINLHIAEAKGTIADLMKAWLPVQSRYLQINQANSRLLGGTPMQGRGIWFPRKPVDDSFVAYVVDSTSHDPSHVKQIVGRSLDDLETRVNGIRADLVGTSKKVISYAEMKETHNHLYQYAKMNELSRADVALTKRGIPLDDIPVDGRGFQEILDGLSTEAWNKHRNLFVNSNPELFNGLDDIIKHQTALGRSSAERFALKRQGKLETAELTKKTLLNYDLTKDFKEFEAASNTYSAVLDTAISKTSEILGKITGKASITQADYDGLAAKLQEANLPNPYRSYLDFIQQAKPELVPKSQAFIAQASSVMVAANLRFLEASHAIVTTLSTPVILGAELAHKKFPMKFMMEGVKLARGKSPEAMAIMKRARDLGYAKPHLSEIDDLMYNLAVKPNKVQAALNSKFIKLGSKLSDASEGITREVAYATGYRMAQANHGPKAAKEILEAYAFAFTNRTMGNYTTRQRPTVFQGALGATVGLYQTFMMTMAQNMFRFLEAGDRRALVQLFGSQGLMFGTQSVPGYGVVNDVLGAWINDDNSHVDITQTIYNALGDDTEQSRSMAEMVLYGFPAWATQTGFHTRAEISPRSPVGITRTGLEFAPPLLNGAIELMNNAWDTASNLGNVAAIGGSIPDVGRAALEGVAAQFLWRPGARAAEWALGYSKDRSGTVLSTEEEVRGFWPTAARIMGSRPLKEQALRQVKFYGKYYDSVDSLNRRKAIKSMKSLVAGESSASLGGVMQDYLTAGGTYRGWSQSMQQAYMSSDVEFADKLAERVTKQPGIYDIVNSYAF